MADANKTVKVTIDVVVNQAKAALADIQSATKKATDNLNKMNVATVDAGRKTSGFFDSTTTSVLKGVAAYDLLRKGATVAFDFFKSSVQESIDASRVMSQLRVNVENVGLSFDEVAPKVEAYSKQMIQMGFEDTATTESLSKLIVVTGNYEDALKLNTLAMNLARSKNIDLADATRLVTQVSQGNTKELKMLGIELDENASAADNLSKMNDKLAGSAEAFAESAGGKLAIVNARWAEMKQEVGDKLVPVMEDFMNLIAENEDTILAFANGIVKIAEGAAFAAKGLVGLFNAAKAGFSNEAAKWTGIAGSVSGGLERIGLSSKEVTSQINFLSKGFKETSEEAWNNALSLYDQKKAADAANTTAVKTKESFAGIGTAAKGASKDVKEQEDALTQLKNALSDVISKQSEFSFKSVADYKRFEDVLQDTKMKQEDWVKSTKQGFEAFGKAVDQAGEDVEDLEKKLKDARDAFNEFLTSTKSEGASTFAQIVHEAEQALPELRKELEKARSKAGQEGSAEEIARLEKEIAEKQGILTSAQQSQYQSNQQFLDELAFLRQQDQRNELDQAYALMQRKIDIKTQEFQAEEKMLQEQIRLKEEERDKYVLAQLAMTQAFAKNVAARMATGKTEIAALRELQSAVQGAAAAYQALAASSAAAASAKAAPAAPKRAQGGPVAPGVPYLVGENGPEMFTPSVNGSITQNKEVRGGGVTIVINNPSVRNDRDIDRIVSEIETAFSRRDELARIGAYK